MLKVPSEADYRAYDGAHCFNLWRNLPDSWRCPSCSRSKFELLRWTTRRFRQGVGACPPFSDWFAGLHAHHDHAADYGNPAARFPETVICDQCNVAEGRAKRKLGLPLSFSFSPVEIAQFVVAFPHRCHAIDLAIARRIFGQLRRSARGAGGA